MQRSQLSAADISTTLAVLHKIAADRGLLAAIAEEQRAELLKAASQVAFPSRAERRKQNREKQKRRRRALAQQKTADEEILAQIGIRAQFEQQNQFSTRQLKRPCPSAPFETSAARLMNGESPNMDDEAKFVRLTVPRNCYICKSDYDRLHFFYDSMCPDCAEFNWQKRNQTADLSGRVALVTGGRVKIGYQAALKLLRAGATVIVTTRFPRDGASRFLTEEDYGDWKKRLHIHGLDLRHTPSVEALADHLVTTMPRLDYILNNACQTVRRPPAFYEHLMQAERELHKSLPNDATRLLESHEALCHQHDGQLATGSALSIEVADTLAGIQRSAELSQLPLVNGDEAGTALFPKDEYDVDQQQVDLRRVNSWRLKLAEVPTVELLEVHLVNAVAPFVLNARLKPLMLRSPERDKQIVNVSAMEGIFYRAFKTDKHPHTNMAKAALNMMTRTSAQDYAKDGIFMNSVDTGWITDEDPADIAKRKKEDLGFSTPLDLIDAAARICDPVFVSAMTGECDWGKFYKDYVVSNW